MNVIVSFCVSDAQNIKILVFAGLNLTSQLFDQVLIAENHNLWLFEVPPCY